MQIINCKYFFSQEEIDEIIRLYLLPESLSKIAKKIGVKSRTTIKKVLIENRIELHTPEQILALNNKYRTQHFKDTYGVDNPYQLDSVKETSKQTKLMRYGDANYHNKAKLVQTCQERYGTTNGGWTESAQEKIKQTNLEKFGVEYSIQSAEVRQKAKQTFLEKYGVEHPAKTKEFQNKVEQTMLEKYGVRRYAQTEEFHYKSQRKYKYENETFDSFPELAYYVYNIDHSIQIKRAPTKISYIHENIEHYYIPDFEVRGQLIEIKGDQFFKEDGTMQCPFDHAYDSLAEAKHQCMLENNVKILRSSDYQFAVDYFNSNYNKDDYLVKT